VDKFFLISVVNSRKFELFGASIVNRIYLRLQIAIFCFGPALGLFESEGVKLQREGRVK
jgi:hypothetical protein